MVGVSKWNGTLLGTLFGALMLNALCCPQSAPRGRSLSELSVYLACYTEPRNHHSDEYQTRDNDMDEPKDHHRRGSNYNRGDAYERKITSEDHANRIEGYELDPVDKNKLCDKCKAYNRMQEIDVYRNGNKMKLQHEKDASVCQVNQHILEKFKSDGRPPFGCTLWDLSQSLSNKEILKKVTYIAFDISLRKAFIGYYYFIIFLNRCYYRMMYKMNRWFINVANTHNIPEDTRVEYWAECRKNLMKDLAVLEQISKKYFDIFIRRDPRVWVIHYEFCLESCRTLWKKAMLENRVKWGRTLAFLVIEYSNEMRLMREERRKWKSRDKHDDEDDGDSDDGDSDDGDSDDGRSYDRRSDDGRSNKGRSYNGGDPNFW
ncbi:hypothetical protein C922_02593 [Plasmodium inui San Antonio 1]|uniref:Plasmodium RESA N-terminal domain-containing protein n=1 Tax=Plasmodium inui San Antonio 1 TaxID=1237626 RepID=W7ADA3_9APIC|nr:hypothetical protein C922_02593 [Plasmodium inui San Antonio 1]EUD67009.1 hypothetical protein C922_02593 [Plasmodium inui San Antonio 1]